MTRGAWIALSAAMLAGCTLLVGTDTRVVGDAGIENDATIDDVVTPPSDAPTPDAAHDAGDDAPDGCDISDCLVEAGACTQGCTATDKTCRQNCSGNPCKTACDQVEVTCISSCVVTCAECTATAGCANQAACED